MELSCQSVVEGLARRGHEVRVLTSTYGVTTPAYDGEIARVIYLDMEIAPLQNIPIFFFDRKRRLASNLKELDKLIDVFTPDVIFIWGMWNVHRSLAYRAEERMTGRVLFRFGDYWPLLAPQSVQYWEGLSPNLAVALGKRTLRPAAKWSLDREPPFQLTYPYCYCISQAVKEKLLQSEIPIKHASIIHNGLDPAPFADAASRPAMADQNVRRIVYVGRLTETKGVHILVDAFVNLLRLGTNGYTLKIVGTGSTEYVNRLLDQLAQAKVPEDNVAFAGMVPAADVPQLLGEADILVVPSTWQEPFGRVVVEGMLAARVVVASAVGGIPEIIQHEVSGILFEPGDTQGLTNALVAISEDPMRAQKLAARGHEEALENFVERRMLDEIEQLLMQTARNGRSWQSGAASFCS